MVGLNILFYWTKDENFYAIDLEKSPIVVRRIFPNPDYEGKSEYSKAGVRLGPSTHSDGDIIATFEAPTLIWNNLTISGATLNEVFKHSVTMDLD